MRTPADSSRRRTGDAERAPAMQGGPLGRPQALLESRPFQRAITGVIAVNAVTLGLETSVAVMSVAGDWLVMIDHLCLFLFVVEIVAKLVVYRARFHHDPWNLFDCTIVAIALIPATGSLSVLRALRILRVLRLVSAVPSMRRVVAALLHAIPGMSSIVTLLALVFYVFSVMATKLFGVSFPEWFGTIGASAYSLFQIMTLESWSMGIVRPVMETYPLAWLFFVPFIIVTSFTVLNLFIGIIVDAMQSQHQAERASEREEEAAQAAKGHVDRTAILAEIRALRTEIAELKAQAPGATPGDER